ncbi:dTMP kinase [Rubrivirga litoralis]|uniref:Thymidylate kinase n=1 Tax=Rubrivirga litoralis TaxID=3075598 RepID=A0ABU3BQX5_9BACT|nr:dTMP kinase [Rubrivirga sp. F394]MDT0631695.1 dTMP kinase [Rubrivirga sp. F394]
MSQPLFISFEGIDGSGKSTQAKLLAGELRRLQYDVVEVREPGGTPLGEDLRGIVLDSTRTVSPRTELLLFSAARSHLVDTVIKPALSRGAIVIADRFADSSTAYQGGGRSLKEFEWFETFNDFVVAGRQPDRTYFIDVTPQQAKNRRDEGGSDRIEKEDIPFYKRVRDAYFRLYESNPDRIIRLDGAATAEAIRQNVLDDILGLLNPNRVQSNK